MRAVFWAVLSMTLLAGCHPKIDFGPNEGYEGRDNSNYSVGPDDTTDWISDDKWTKQEQALFDDLPLQLNGPQAGGVRRLSLYPNPAETQAIFSFERTSSLQGMLKIVDKKHNVVTEHEISASSGSLGFSFNVNTLQLKKDAVYRLYYVFYNGNTLHYKGHGDIKIAK